VGKFGYAIGTGTWEIRAKLREAGRDCETGVVARLVVFRDEGWPHVAALAVCSRAAGVLARSTLDLKVRSGWGSWSGGELSQGVRPHIWYFALSKCPSGGGESHNATLDVDYELRFRQHDGSELSVELLYMPSATLLAVLCLSGFLVCFWVRCRRLQRTLGALPPVIKALVLAVSLQWTAQVLHLVHLHCYEKRGIGESFAEASADMLFMLSQVVSSTLLIMIARGYTLLSSRETELQSMRLSVAMTAILHIVLVGHGKMQGDHSDKHHENEGASGCALLAVRLLLFVWFTTSVRSLHWQCKSFRLQGFLHRFQCAGSLYFLAYPAICLVVQVFAPYLRHPIMHLGLATMQTAASLWLSELFLSRGAYFQISTLSSPLLPGGLGIRASMKGE
jgi:hypothetical protein